MHASVRTAKAKLSELLDRAAKGEEVVITSGGRAKARLVAVTAHVPYRVHRDLLRRRVRPGPTADEIIREDRDSRD